MARTVQQIEGTLRSTARSYKQDTEALVHRFVKRWAPAIEDAYAETGTYIIPDKRNPTGKREGSPVSALSAIANEEGVGPEFSKMLRIRKDNRGLWKLYLKGGYRSLHGSYVAILKEAKGTTHKVRVPRAIRSRLEVIAKSAERQGLRVTFHFSRIGK